MDSSLSNSLLTHRSISNNDNSLSPAISRNIVPIQNLPTDINAEVLIGYYPPGTFDVIFKGPHKRNAYKDVLALEGTFGAAPQKSGRARRVSMDLGRNSLYNSLPEYLFHPIDRFDLPERDKKSRFDEEYDLQEQEKEDAFQFFAPIDLALLHQRVRVSRALQEFASDNKVLIDALADSLTVEQRKNRFISRSLTYLPYCKTIRGDRTLITLMLRKVLMDEGLVLDASCLCQTFEDASPRYAMEVGTSLSALYLGDGYNQEVLSYDVRYWNDEACDEHFDTFLDELEAYRAFVQDYFLSVEAVLSFNVQTDAPPLRLNDTTIYNYLNYNTNL